MSTPVLLGLEHAPIQISTVLFNDIYNNAAQEITVNDMSASDEIHDSIQHALRESYITSSSLALLGRPDKTPISTRNILIDKTDILASIVSSLTPSAINAVGQMLHNEHQRDASMPFETGDIYTFQLRVKPGDFKVLNDSPNNTVDGITVFQSRIEDVPIRTSPGEITDISQWVYTLDSETGPYYDGTEKDGFIVTMAFRLIDDEQPPEQPPEQDVYVVDWVVQPTFLNNKYVQSLTTTAVDSNLYTYVSFYSRSSSHSNSFDLVVAKFNSSGSLLWSTTEPNIFQEYTNTQERPKLILSESTNQVIVAYITMLGNVGGTDTKIISLDATTSAINWTYTGPEINSVNYDGMPELALSTFDNTFVLVHSVRGNTSETGNVHQGSYDDVLISKFDFYGNHIWTTHTPIMNTHQTEIHPSIAISPPGDIYIVYMSLGSVNGFINEGGYDIFFAKADPFGSIVSVQKLYNVNTSSSDVVPTLRYSSYDDTLYLSHYRQYPFEIVISKLTTEGNVIWTETNGVNIDAINEYVGMDVDNTNGRCVFAYSSSPVRPGDYQVTIGTIDTNGIVRYLDRPDALQSISPEYNPSVSVAPDGSIRIAYDTEGSVDNGNGGYQGERDIVVASLSKVYS